MRNQDFATRAMANLIWWLAINLNKNSNQAEVTKKVQRYIGVIMGWK